MMDYLKSKIQSRDCTIGIIGLGYVGLPLAIEFAKKFSVIGYDLNCEIVNQLKYGKSHIIDISCETIAKCLDRTFFPTDNSKELGKCDFIIICVPTPLYDDKRPNLEFIKNSCRAISETLKRNQFIILESTTYPGTTDEIVVPILEESGLVAGVDFGVAYSPERIDPGNQNYSLSQIPKVVGGINSNCTEIAAELYGSIIDRVVMVNDTRTAEAVKMMENIFRNVNIALVNELSLIFEKMGINTWDVIDAASSKPYGYMSFYPGPGVGGHCIPLDPFYMSYQAKKFGFIPRFIETSGEINEFMQIHAVNLIVRGLKRVNKHIYRSKIAVMGLAYKKNIDDSRESPSIKIIDELVNRGAEVTVYDPFVCSIQTKTGLYKPEPDIETTFDGIDCAIFIIDHDIFRNLNLTTIKERMASPVIVDCKNIFKDLNGFVYLGIGKTNEMDD